MARQESYLGLDAGTQSVKAGLWSARGELLASASRPLAVSTPRDGWAEQDPDTWWTAAAAALRRLGPRARRAGVGGLGVAWQRETFTLTEPGGRALRPALLWLDVRAHAEARSLAQRAARIHEITGVPPDVTTTLPRMAWLRTHEPALFRGRTRWEDVGSRLLARLTGRRVTCVAGADTSGLVARDRPAWCPEVLDLAGLRAEDLPELVGPGEVVGPLLPEAARVLGLPAGLPVVAAGGDGQVFSAAALGGSAGDVFSLTLGTSVVLGFPSAEAPVSSLYRTLRAAWPGEGRLLEAVLQSGLYLFRWLEDRLCAGRTTSAHLEREAAGLPAGSGGLVAVPHWWGTRFPTAEPDARGAVLGWSDRHTATHLYRALLEGSAFEIRFLAERIQPKGPAREGHVVVGGGGAKSALWLAVLQDVLGRRIDVAPVEPVAAGAALLAALAVGGGEVGWRGGSPATRATAARGSEGARAFYDRLYREVWMPYREASTGLSVRLTRLTREP